MDNNKKQKTTVSFKNGIHVHTDSEDVDVSMKGIHVETDNESVHLDKDEMLDYARSQTLKHSYSIIFSLVMLIIAGVFYVIIGRHYGMHGWKFGWLVFLLVPIINSFIRAVKKGKPVEFEYPVLATFVFLLLGFFKDCWHPAWIVFLTIPVYYIICDQVQKRKND